MEHPRVVDLIRRVVIGAKSPEPMFDGEPGEIPVSHYLDANRLAREREVLFAQRPIAVAHVSELATPGACIVSDELGTSLLVVRGTDGVLRAFRNACRHRGTRLVRESPCRAKAFVCPYHGWTYGLDGALMHVPHAAAFPQLDIAAHGLSAIDVEERHGIVWVRLDPRAPDVASHLGALDDELRSMQFETHIAHRSVVREQDGNWKLLLEAFLEGYHIRTLHRGTIYPFFVDARAIAESVGPHVRHASARRTSLELSADDANAMSFAARPLRDLATFAYVIFPNTIIIAHPDWTSLVRVVPRSVDRFAWSHTMLLPQAPADDTARAHFDRSFGLIEENVFQREDLFAIREMQIGLASGALTHTLFGRLESAALHFHRAIRDAFGE